MSMRVVIISFFLLVFSLSFFAPYALAQGPLWNDVGCFITGEPCEFCDAVKVGVNIITFISKISFVIMGGMMGYGGLMIMLAGGSTEKAKRGKSIITYGIAGGIITLSSWLIINTVLSIAVDSSKFAFPWEEIKCDPRGYDDA